MKKAKKVAQRARKAYEDWYSYFKINIDMYHYMHEFVLGRQWNDDEEEALKTFKKVPLQFNKLAAMANSLLGEQQQNTPQIQVNPLADCDEETAEIRSLITKDIMLSTDAKTVYQRAAMQAAIGGYGAFVIDTDYVHQRSFDTDIVYHSIKDATKCYWDIGAENTAKTDGLHAGYLSCISRQKFKKLYGKDAEKSIGEITSVVDAKAQARASQLPDYAGNAIEWATKDMITVLHHFDRSYEIEMLYKLSNGVVVNELEMDELINESQQLNAQMMQQQMMMQAAMQQAQPQVELGAEQMQMGNEQVDAEQMQGSQDINPLIEQEQVTQSEDMLTDDLQTLYYNGEPVRIEDEKEVKISKITHYKIAGDYVLEESEFPAEDLPVIFMDQNSYFDKNAKQVCRPFLIDAVDAQRYLNYLGTQSAFVLKVSRYDQFLVSKRNIQSLDTQAIWRDPTAVQGGLYYDESPSGNKPEQLRPPELSQSLVTQYQRAIEDLYTSTGLYPTRMGEQGNETSGKAIDARTRQGSYQTFVYFNSINRAITEGGKVLNQMIPKVYDTQRVLNLMTPDEGRKNVTINQEVDPYGSKIKNDLRKGTYEIVLEAGASYEGQKQQALESLNMVLQANPSLFNMVADLYTENLPLVNNIELRNRFKTLVPPEVVEAGKTGRMPQQAQMPSAQDQAAMAEAEYKRAQIEIKKQELEMQKQEIEMQIEKQQIEFEMHKLDSAAELEESKLRFMAETDRTRSDNAIAHADNITKLLTSKQN